MDQREGFVANLVTAALVSAGAVGGLAMSTTHVSSCAIIGIRAQKGSGALKSKTLRDILLAWLMTVPSAAVFGNLAYVAARVVQVRGG